MPEALVISVNLADGISLAGSEAAGANWTVSIQNKARWDRLVIGIFSWAGKDSKAWSRVTTGTDCVAAILIRDQMGTPGEGTGPTRGRFCGACRPGALTRRGSKGP